MNLLVVGSSVIDLFLTVDQHHFSIDNNKVSLSLGDKVPSQIKSFAVGGNGANVSVGLTRLGIPTTFYTYIGNDILSREIEEKLSAEGVEIASQRDEGTAPLHIIIDFDSDRIILSHYEKRNHIFDYKGPPHFDYIYLTSLADEWEQAYEQVYKFSTMHNIPIAFSPGSRQLAAMNDLFSKVLKYTKIFFCNSEEAKMVTGKTDADCQSLLQAIKQRGPEIVSITDGGNKSWAIDRDNSIFAIDPLPTQPNSEKTGAGDAYATGFLGGYLKQKTLQQSMQWGAFNASGVMRKTGAQEGLLTEKEMTEWEKTHTNSAAERV